MGGASSSMVERERVSQTPGGYLVNLQPLLSLDWISIDRATSSKIKVGQRLRNASSFRQPILPRPNPQLN